METEDRLEVSRGQGKGEWALLLNGHRISVGNYEKSKKLMVMVAQHCEYD